jgi:type IV secretion system protein VirD4
MSEPRALIRFGASVADGKLVGDGSDAHIMTIAPTGAGKGTTSIIPNLLMWPGSVFVIDPKGENIAATLTQRRKLNTDVFLLDPFFIVEDRPELQRARFNPMDFIELDRAGITQADRLADALIIREKDGENSYFSNEARALLKALILHVRSDPMYEDSRNLGTVNEIACDPVRLIGDKNDSGEMQANGAYDGLIARTATRMAAKGDREGPAVWSTLQANLSQFLDDPRIADSLRTTDFDFAMLVMGKISVFAVLPAQYLGTFNRWLRLLVESALDRLYEMMGQIAKPDPPALFILDEFAHLGNLEAVKTAYGLARGAGLKIWACLQSLSQLDDVFGEHVRENFIANSGAIEIFNTVDNSGCKYFSEMIGQEYVVVQSKSESTTTQTKGVAERGKAGETLTSGSVTVNHGEELRYAMLPADIAALDPSHKILFRRGFRFELLQKVPYWSHEKLRALADQ